MLNAATRRWVERVCEGEIFRATPLRGGLSSSIHLVLFQDRTPERVVIRQIIDRETEGEATDDTSEIANEVRILKNCILDR